MHVITSMLSPRDDSQKKPIVVHRDNTERTGAQASILLNISGFCAGFLRTEAETGTEVEIDSDAKAEAKKTFELAQSRLRDLIDDQARWDRGIDPIAEDIRLALEADRKRVDAERAKHELRQRPSSRFQPNIARALNGQWVAWFGRPSPTAGSIRGIGNTPQEAVDAFDRAFSESGAPLEELRPQEPEPDAPTPPPAPRKSPRRKK